MKRVRLRDWYAPIALLILCLIAYGPLIPSLGVYWDDWPSLWFLHFYGPGVFPKAFAIDRPAQGYLFTLTSALVGESMLAWQMFGILARWLCALALYALLRLVWPQHKSQAVWVAALFLVYPGFTQNYIPITYGHQFLVYTAFLVSLALMVKANLTAFQNLSGFPKSDRFSLRYWLLTAASLLLAVWSMFALEYFFGLELLRPALLALALANAGALAGRTPLERLRLVLARWLPYAVTAGLFLAWRLSNPTPRGSVVIFEHLAAGPAAAVFHLATTIIQDLFSAVVLAWGRSAAYLNPAETKSRVLIAYWLVVLAAAGVTLVLWKDTAAASGEGQGEKVVEDAPPNLLPESEAKADAPTTPPGRRQAAGTGWAVQAILLGLYALAIGGWPVWVTDLRLDLSFPWDRFTLPLIPGAALLLVGLLDLLPTRRASKAVLLAVLVGLAAGLHFHVALDYRRDWAAQKDFFWQMAWRAPSIETGTLLLAAASPFAYATDNSLTAPVNWIYDPDLKSERMPYFVYALDARLGENLNSLQPGRSVEHDYRATTFTGSTSQVLVLFYDPPRCLEVLDPRLDDNLPNKPNFIAAAMPLSRPELIHDQQFDRKAIERLFGPEPEHNWCYYYQQAELAVQQEDWDRVVALAGQALESKTDLGRDQAYELVPFIRGYAHSGNYPAALALSRRAAHLFPLKMPAILCSVWQQIVNQSPPATEDAAALDKAAAQWKCEAQ